MEFWQSVCSMLLLIFLLQATFNFATECPVNFLQIHHRCYYFSNDKLQWLDAHFRCKELKSNLAILKTRNQDHLMRDYLWSGFLESTSDKVESVVTVPTEWWIGASYDWKQKTWKWAPNGREVTYNQFVHNRKNTTALQWHCATLDEAAKYRWNSKQCTEKKNYICQKKLNHTEIISNEVPLIASPYSHIYDDDNKEMRDSDNNQPGYIQKRPVRTKTKFDHNKPKVMCPKGYRHVKSMCYKFSKETATWQEAYYACDAEYNSTLAILHNKREDAAVRRSAKRLGNHNYDRWIGGMYDWEEMAWKWATTGSVIQHQAYDRELLRWHCLVWSPRITDKWTSDNCVKKKHYICQTQGTLVKFPSNLTNIRLRNKSKRIQNSNRFSGT